jgi:hypothetical protein
MLAWIKLFEAAKKFKVKAYLHVRFQGPTSIWQILSYIYIGEGYTIMLATMTAT